MTAPLKKDALSQAPLAAARHEGGWRRGKPEEDPDKMKRWGVISAKPSEFLVRMRGGKVVSAGQGATVFKWPWQSVAIVPTTVQRLRFTADQITAEKVGVEVTGIAVYRIAQPLIASRMLNFSYPERAQEKLADMLEEMFVGAARRLVANLTLEHCLTRRKDALSNELMREIAPVVGGTGRPDDSTAKGWGVVIDSIEIQDVRVTSAAVFSSLQARYRQELERQAREAELARLRFVRQDEASSERQIELARVASQTEVRQQKQAADEQAKLEQLASDARVEAARLEQQRQAKQGALELQRQLQLQELTSQAELARQHQTAEEASKVAQLQAESRLQHERLRAEAERLELETAAEAARHAARLEAERQAAAMLVATTHVAQARKELAEIELATVSLETQKQQLAVALELERARGLKAVSNDISAQAIQLAVAERLPQLAAAFQQQMGEVHVTAVDGANPFGYVAAAVEGVLGLARSAGLELPGKAAKE